MQLSQHDKTVLEKLTGAGGCRSMNCKPPAKP